MHIILFIHFVNLQTTLIHFQNNRSTILTHIFDSNGKPETSLRIQNIANYRGCEIVCSLLFK